MKRIGLLSDTHGHWDEHLANFFENCDEIWHAGDIGNLTTADAMGTFKPLKAVHGNIDDFKVRVEYPGILRLQCEEVSVLMTHMGGYPGKYEPAIRALLEEELPKVFICGHSHILKVIYDKKLNILHINPGAAGKQGIHRVRTAIRFTIEGAAVKDLEVLEIPRD